MRLLSLTLSGQYKGLRSQNFNFYAAQGNIIAFIGLNGSGKSQLLELIAESFGYLERFMRSDFKCRNWFPNLSVELCYMNQKYDSEIGVSSHSIKIDDMGDVTIYRDGILINIDAHEYSGVEEEILPSQIIGYSSGLNENLQRAFMKNTIQYLDIMNVRRQWEKRLTVINKARNEKR